MNDRIMVNGTQKERLYLSFGENCLTDDILNRHHLKSYSTPYSSSRSNVEYILQIERDQFRNFINPNLMAYEMLDGKKVLRLKTYDALKNQYNWMHMNGFEFTHHDVVASKEQRDTFERRCERLRNMHDSDLFIFCHHRICEKTNRVMLLEHLAKLKELYSKRCRYTEVILFTQVLINNPAERRIEHWYENAVHVYVLYTENEWAGTDQDIFWARCDDDLLRVMLNDVANMQRKWTLKTAFSRAAFLAKYKNFQKTFRRF